MSVDTVVPDHTRMFAEAAESADFVARQLDANSAIVRDLAELLRARDAVALGT